MHILYNDSGVAVGAQLNAFLTDRSQHGYHVFKHSVRTEAQGRADLLGISIEQRDAIFNIATAIGLITSVQINDGGEASQDGVSIVHK